jgi:hypothetical protein
MSSHDGAGQNHGRAMEGLAMSLSVWEQQALDSIKDGLVGADPQLVALLTTFTQLASTEEMPVQEMIPAASRRTLLWPLRRPRHNCRAEGCRRSRPMPGFVRLQWIVLLVWLVTTMALIAVAILMSRGGGGPVTCPGSFPATCAHSAPG